ncbi:MAG: hypothetical protein RIS44_2792, partial [Pseudomonadota bacterium]
MARPARGAENLEWAREVLAAYSGERDRRF